MPKMNPTNVFPPVTPPANSTKTIVRKVVTKHDKEYDLAIELTRVVQAVESIIEANEESISLLKESYKSMSRKRKKALNNLEDSSIDGLNTVMDKLLLIMKLTDKESYARWTFQRNSTIQKHQQRNHDFIYNPEDHYIVNKEIPTKMKINEMLKMKDSTTTTSRKSVPRRKSHRVKLNEMKKVIQERKVFPCFEDVHPKEDQPPFRRIIVNSEREYKLPLPKHYEHLYTTTEALIHLKTYYNKKGFQGLVTSMHKMKMLGHAKQAFTNKMSLYIDHGILPTNHDESTICGDI